MFYKQILGERLINDCQADEMIKLLRDGDFYPRSNVWVKNGHTALQAVERKVKYGEALL